MINFEAIYVIFLLLSLIIMFYLAYKFPEKRTIIFLSIAILIIIIGNTTGYYTKKEIWTSIYNSIPILLLIIILEIFSILILDSGFPKLIISKLFQKTNSPILISILFIILTYTLSLFINNLATILVLLPIILLLSSLIKLRIEPLLVIIIISSNIGGASTMIGDFPNMVISRYANVDFGDFIFYMGLPLILYIILITILYKYCFSYEKKPYKETQSFESSVSFHVAKKYFRTFQSSSINITMIKTIIIFICMLFSFLILKRIDPVLIAAIFLVILLLSLNKSDKIFKLTHMSVLMWFLALFIIAGAFEPIISKLSISLIKIIQSPFLLCIILLLGGTLITGVLSAGPTTILLIPLAITFNTLIPNEFAFWSLSLGVLAGSSLTPIGATAGPIVLAHYSDFYNKEFPWKKFLKISIPTVSIFSILSVIYIYISLSAN